MLLYPAIALSRCLLRASKPLTVLSSFKAPSSISARAITYGSQFMLRCQITGSSLVRSHPRMHNNKPGQFTANIMQRSRLMNFQQAPVRNFSSRKPFPDRTSIFAFIPPQVKIFAGLFITAVIIVFIAFPMLLLYLPLAVLVWLWFKKRKVDRRADEFRKYWESMVSEATTDTSRAQLRRHDVSQLNELVQRRLSAAIAEDGDFAYLQVGLDPARDKGKLLLGPCLSIDRENRIQNNQTEIVTIMTYEMRKKSGADALKVADVTAIIKSSFSVGQEEEDEESSLKIVIDSPEGEWTISGITHGDDYSRNASDTVIDVKPRNTHDD
ncbi:hypothetical protein V1514DRAFT_328138 [Lipomyces japonicus]|uniref:uncharacterized protein n=1 Tax=Lipomyces japonicus TaxID=56871 RepID=UPI0034CE95ED